MKDSLKIKQQLFEACLQFVNNRSLTIKQMMNSNQKALLSETKSSAGDKHETGRAMLQLEMEKASQQLASVQQTREVLTKISIEKTSKVSCLGSVVITNKATVPIKAIIDSKTIFFPKIHIKSIKLQVQY